MTAKRPNAKVLRLLGMAKVLRLLGMAMTLSVVNARVLKQPGLAKKSPQLHIAAEAWGMLLLLLPWEEAGVQHCVRSGK